MITSIATSCQSHNLKGQLYASSVPPSAADGRTLEEALRGQGSKVAPQEAKLLAETALASVEAARKRYRMRGGAIQRNLAVNMGLAEWGLCWQWTEWLGRRLVARPFRTLEVRWGCAHRGSTWREHNAVVITACGQAFEEGLVLDPWRKSGRLTWVRVHDDHFPWKHDRSAEKRWMTNAR